MHNDKNRRRLLFYLHERKKNVTQNFTINVNLIGFEFTQTVKGGSIIFFINGTGDVYLFILILKTG